MMFISSDQTDGFTVLTSYVLLLDLRQEFCCARLTLARAQGSQFKAATGDISSCGEVCRRL